MYRTVTAEKLSNDVLDCVWTINEIEVLFSCALLKHDKLKHCAGNKLSFYYSKETLCWCEKKIESFNLLFFPCSLLERNGRFKYYKNYYWLLLFLR